MFWSGIVMLIINGLYSRWLVTHVFDIENINHDIPFITQLIVGPVTVAVLLWSVIKKQNLSFCRDCKMHHGSPAERGFLGVLFTQESQFQARLFLGISVFCTIVSWAYYLFFYANEYFSLLDKYIFIWCPCLLFIVALIYTAARYISIWRYYEHNTGGSYTRPSRHTLIRYLMIYDNYIGLHMPDMHKEYLNPADIKADTPVSLITKFKQNIPVPEARSYFEQLTRIPDAEIRFLYTNITGNTDCNIFHFIVFLNQEQKETYTHSHDDIKWFTMYETGRMINKKETNSLLSAEIVRIHTIAMAWKTYRPDGKRRYDIKHYTPTFHLRDLHKWDIDFNDTKWLYVADNNEDVPFFRIRRFWRKYINGIGD